MLQPGKISQTPQPTELKGWLSKVLHGTLNHYGCILPRKTGKISSAALRAFYSGIAFGKDQRAVIEQLPENATVVYVNKHKSKFEFLFFHTVCGQHGMPVPTIGFGYRIILWQSLSRLFRMFLARLHDIVNRLSFQDPYSNGFLQEQLLGGSSGFLSLVEKGEFYRRFVKAKIDPLRFLIECQQDSDRPIYLVPAQIFFSKNPIKSNPNLIDMLFGPEVKPGRIRRLITLFRKPGKVFVEVSEPINLQDFLQGTDSRGKQIDLQSLVLRRNLLKLLNLHRKSTIGPMIKTVEELKESILTNERLLEFMEKHSETRGVPLSKVRKEASGYVDEIATKYSFGLIKMASHAVEYIANTMFDGISLNQDRIRWIKSASQKGPLILVPCHKSHIDYLILSYVMYINNLPCPHVAAGKNLAFWPMGPIFRRGGAFFIRRTFRGAVLYSKVFTEYLYKLLEEGFNIEFFIEGTRSRTGKLILPKLGFLSMLLDAYRNGACEDMIFVPIYISYDRVLEESAYIHELEGGQKNPENLLQVIKARKFLMKRFGKIYIRFHDPISLNQLLEDASLNLQEISPKDKNAFCRDLGFRIINAIGKVTVVTAHGLCASALLNTPKSRFGFGEILSIVEIYLRYLQSQNTQLADTLHIDQNRAIENAFNEYAQRKFVEAFPREKGDTETKKEYRINENERTSLEYYKNNCVSYFIPAAFTAMAILRLDAFQFSASDLHEAYNNLRKLFQYEFAYDLDVNSEYLVRKTIKAFIDEAVLIPHQTLPDTYNVTSAGFRKLKLFANFLKAYFESYLIVLAHYAWVEKSDNNAKDRLKKIVARGRRMYKNREIERKESLSKVSYQNAVEFFTSRGIKSSENEEKIVAYVNSISHYLNRLH